jgi:DNA-binding MarR family transcriptional regulator
MKTIDEELKMPVFYNEFQRAFLNLIFTSNWFEGLMQKALKNFNLTNAQYNVLRILRGQKGKPINAFSIQERMLYPNSNVTRILEKLVEKGLVLRTCREENRRMVDNIISAKGLELLSESDELAFRFYDNISHYITEDEASQINNLLDKLRVEP